MSKPTALLPAKRGRKKLKTIKTRQNISIDPGVLKTARKMAFADGLALSTWLEQMVRERINANTAKA